MKVRLLAVLVLGLLLAAQPKKGTEPLTSRVLSPFSAAADDKDQGDAAKKDLKALEGTWKAINGEGNGKPLADEDLKEIKTYELVIKGDKYTQRAGGQEKEQGTLKLDPSKKPKAIDIKITQGEDQGKDQYGVYQVEGDKFTICFAPPGKERPKQLKTEAGTEQTLIVFERAKN